jgi:hypothetical protein
MVVALLQEETGDLPVEIQTLVQVVVQVETKELPVVEIQTTLFLEEIPYLKNEICTP